MFENNKLLVGESWPWLKRLWPSAAIGLCLIGSSTAMACGFHLLPPEKTLTQHLAASDRIVLVRESGEQPFAFATDAVLAGLKGDVDITQLVDSVTRRKLAINPEDAVLFAHDDEGRWRRLAYVDAATRPIYQAIVERAPDWAANPNDSERFWFFADIHDHTDRAIRQLALSELDRSAYRDLREMDVRLPSAELLSAQSDFNEYPWVPIRIQLLGIKGDSIARSAISAELERAAQSGRTVNLAAWATALIEVDGEPAIDRLSASFLLAENRNEAATEAVLQALALHGAQGDPAYSPAIDRVLEALIAAEPKMAPVAARALAAQGDHARVAIFERVMRDRVLRTPAEIMPVVAYLAMAQTGTSDQVTLRN